MKRLLKLFFIVLLVAVAYYWYAIWRLTLTIENLNGSVTAWQVGGSGPNAVHFYVAGLDPKIDDNTFLRISSRLSWLKPSYLGLENTSLTDKALPGIFKLSSLESINISGSKLSAEGVRELTHMPHLKRILIDLVQKSDLESEKNLGSTVLIQVISPQSQPINLK